MIKIIACLIMLIDHIGMIFFPDVLILRCIGRLSMPLFAYCIARGYFYSVQHDTTKRYIKNLLVFSVFSQIPYCFLTDSINIGATWLLSVVLLYSIHKTKSSINIFLVSAGILIIAFVIKVDYGVYGVLMPLVMYDLMICKKDPYKTFLAMIALWGVYVIIRQGTDGSMIQVLSFISIALIVLLDKHDSKVKLPKWVFYWFYPFHLVILIGIKLVLV